jgi:hypothetical protein
MKKILLFFYCISISVLANAQRTCATMDALADQIAANPLLQQQLDAVNQHANQYAASGKKTRLLVTIPVVFHVVYNTAAQNLADAYCIANLDQLNADFAHLNSDTANTPAAFKAFAANTDIQFCLAVRDPLGNATTGITHTQTSVASWSTNNNVKFAANGGVDAWPRDQYLNIWVCNLGSSLLGYAQFPGGGAATDGVVVLYTSVGSIALPNPNGGSYNFGRTATHEVGHWLNMYHIWGDDGGACSGDDLVGDTPNQADNNYGCPTYPLVDACTAASPGVMFMNYMDYVDDNCMNMFTTGQATRMASLFTTTGARYPLLSSLGCTSVAPCSGTPNAGVASALGTDTLCSGSKVITLSGASSGIGISVQWQSSPNNSTWTNAGGTGNGLSYSAPAVPGVMYYHCVTTCATSGASATSNSVAVYSYGVTNVSGNANVCAGGTLTLTANGFGPKAWYSNAAGTSLLFTGNPYIASFGSSTTLYVRTGSSAAYSVGPANNSIGATSTSTSLTNGLYFRTNTALTIDTVFVYPGSAGNLVVLIQDSATSSNIGSYNMTITAAQINTKVAVPIALSCGIGSFKMLASGSTITSLYRNTAGASFPYTIPGIISIIRNINGNANQYRYFYDWKISAGCATALVAVPITVVPTVLSTTNGSILCNGSTTSLTANAGTGFTYTLNGGGANTSGNFTVLGGTYTVSATSTSGCVTSTIVVINQPSATSVTLASVNNTSSCNGSLTATGSGGIAPYTYSINGGAFQSSNLFSNLCTGNYTVCLKDANNCTNCVAGLVNSLNTITVYGSASTTCVGSANGSITASVVGGTAPYKYNLNGGAYQTSNQFTNLAAGVYTLGAKDTNNITGTVLVTVSNSSLAIIASGTSAATATSCNGSVIGTASGGVAPYTYSLNGGAYTANNTFANQCAGSNTICVKDINNCVVCSTYTVQIIVPIAISIPATVQACPNANNGSITALATFGTMPYLYQINTNGYGTNPQFNSLTAGVYTITAKDANNVTTSTVVNLNQSGGLALGSSGIAMSCFNVCNGSISATAGSGFGTYLYTLNGGTPQVSNVFNNLCAGNYTVAAKDGNNCVVTSVLNITAPSAITSVMYVTNIACHYQTNGSVTMNVTGGNAPYQYAITPNPYGTFNVFNGLAAGVYTFMAKDAQNCSITNTATVIEPDVLLATSTTNSSTSTIIIHATGGTLPYSYSINGGAAITDSVFTGLTAGTYSLMVTDARGCKYVTATVLKAPESIYNIQLSQAIQLYPNPSNGMVYLQIKANYNIGLLKINVLDALGKVVVREMLDVNGKTAEKTLHLEHLASANYIIQIMDEHKGVSVHKLEIR